MLNSENRKPLIILASLIFIITALHYSTDVRTFYFHEIYKLLYYIPIILSGFYFGIKGGVISSVIISAVYLPHVIFQWHGGHEDFIHRILETVVYVVIGYIVGKLAESERAQKNRYEQAALKLEESYEKLKYQSEMISEIEDQLRHSERLSVLGELAASLAHEVRNPLGSIKGAVEILQDGYPHEHKNYRFLQILIKEVDRLNSVIENFLGLARRRPTKINKIHIQEEVDSVIQIVSAKARKEKIQIEARLPDKPVYIKADSNKFRQVLLNLLLNAMAASSGGSIKIQSEIKNQTGGTQPCFELCILDNGTGIPEEEIDKIFKPFYTSKKDGTGLGLPIAKRISDEYNWQLSISSKVGEGTRARLCIPLPVEET